MKLPGNTSVERLVFDYSNKLYKENIEDFWDNDTVSEMGFIRVYYRDHIKTDIDEINTKLRSTDKKRKRIK